MHKKFYSKIDKDQIRKDLEAEGFEPLLITNEPGYIYSKHSHPETKVLVFLEGSMEVVVKNKTFVCEKGDKLYIAANTPHEARVGKFGCVFYWAEKVI